MTWCSPITRKAISGAILLGLLHCGGAMAEEHKIYKHVDEKGNVVYSELPPMSGKSAKKLDTQPAYRGQGGYSGSGSPYGDPRLPSQDYRQDQYRNAVQQRQQQMEDARSKRLAELEAECNRNRGTDCNNPDVLRYIESTKIPRPYRR
jgi:hypothetical protein